MPTMGGRLLHSLFYKRFEFEITQFSTVHFLSGSFLHDATGGITSSFQPPAEGAVSASGLCALCTQLLLIIYYSPTY